MGSGSRTSTARDSSSARAAGAGMGAATAKADTKRKQGKMLAEGSKRKKVCNDVDVLQATAIAKMVENCIVMRV